MISFVRVDWTDSSSKPGWYESSDPGDDSSIVSFGLVVSENDKMIRISTSWSEAGECFMDPLTIPKVAVVSITRLPTPEKGD